MQEFISIEDAAHRLSVSARTVYTLVARGDIPSTKVGRMRRIPASAVNAYKVRAIREAQAQRGGAAA